MSRVLPGQPSRALLWFGVLGAPAAWALQEMLGWYFASAPCSTYIANRHFHGQPTGWLVAIHLVLILVTVIAFLASLACWRRARVLDPVLAVLVDRYLGMVGMVVALIVIAALIWGGLGTVMLTPCENMR